MVFFYIKRCVFIDKQQRTDVTIDEHFRKSLGGNYHKLTGGFLTPEDSSSNSSPTERTPGLITNE
jgi:hypothetical protein